MPAIWGYNVVTTSCHALSYWRAGVRLWHKLATSYKQPRMVTYFRLSSPVAASSPTASVLCTLWLRLVEETKAEDSYLAGVGLVRPGRDGEWAGDSRPYTATGCAGGQRVRRGVHVHLYTYVQ